MALLPTILPIHDCISCMSRRSSLFCNMSRSTLADYNRIGSIHSYPPGTVLLREDESGDQVLVMCSGRVKLYCESRSGKTLNLKISVAGDVLGLSAVLSGAKYEATAETINTTEVKEISKDEFLAFLRRNAEAGLHAAQRLSEDYRLALHGARRLALSATASGRIAGILLDWGKAASYEKTGMRFNMAMSHGQLAEFAGTSRETVTRTLATFQRNKTIVIRGCMVHILLPDKMAELAA
jgi:CRP/FNR family cyclic AMP-dependent transcriptional regulator